MSETTSDVPAIEQILHDAAAATDRRERIGEQVGVLVFDQDVLRRINQTGQALTMVEGAEEVLFAALDAERYPIDSSVSAQVLQRIGKELARHMDPETLRSVLAALISTREALMDCVDPDKKAD